MEWGYHEDIIWGYHGDVMGMCWSRMEYEWVILIYSINQTGLGKPGLKVYKGVQPERWLRIRKLEVQGPSNSYF
jgi:hypothetical protein